MKNLSLLLVVFTIGSFTLLDAAGCCGQKRKKKESVISAIQRKINQIIKKIVHEEEDYEPEHTQDKEIVDQQLPQECDTQECLVDNKQDNVVQKAQIIKRNEIMEVVENVVNEVIKEQDEQLTPEELTVVINSLVENIMNQDQQDGQEAA